MDNNSLQQQLYQLTHRLSDNTREITLLNSIIECLTQIDAKREDIITKLSSGDSTLIKQFVPKLDKQLKDLRNKFNTLKNVRDNNCNVIIDQLMDKRSVESDCITGQSSSNSVKKKRKEVTDVANDSDYNCGDFNGNQSTSNGKRTVNGDQTDSQFSEKSGNRVNRGRKPKK